MNRDEILNKVKIILCQSLGVDEDEVQPESSLVADLGAESIDFLDITFRLEREFGLPKIKEGELFPTGIFNAEIDCVKDGIITPRGIALLKEKIPYASFDKWEKNPLQHDVSIIFTVNSLVRFIEMQQVML